MGKRDKKPQESPAPAAPFHNPFAALASSARSCPRGRLPRR